MLLLLVVGEIIIFDLLAGERVPVFLVGDVLLKFIFQLALVVFEFSEERLVSVVAGGVEERDAAVAVALNFEIGSKIIDLHFIGTCDLIRYYYNQPAS